MRALNGVTEQFDQGRFTAIMGPSGSGKSTLLHCLAGLDVLTTGKVYIGDTDLGSLGEKDLTLLRRRNVGFVFQAYNLIPTLTARENILLPLLIAGEDPEPGWFEQVVETMRLGDRLKHRPTELSGGQQQRVAAARALVAKPAIIFADEPSGNLDTKSSAELLGFLQSAVRDFQQTIVMVSHDPVAASYSDQIVFLEDGRIVDRLEDPTPDQVIDRMKQLGA